MNAASSHSGRRDGDLWALTSYFNPAGYRRRLANYRTFRGRLDVPLIAIELAYGEDYALGEDDADILIRLRGGDVLWQKERLLNVALAALPATCTKIALVDCDVFFGAADWSDRLGRLLDRFAVVQPYGRISHLRRDWRRGDDPRPATELSQPSLASAIASGEPVAPTFGRPIVRAGGPSRGFAWAVRREILQAHGLYDACIVGGGDTALSGAAYGCLDDVMRLHVMNARQRDRYIAWAEPFHASVQGSVGALDGDLFHLWHGDLQNRRARERHEQLSALGFDPFADVAADAGGAWRWRTEKPLLHDFVRQYFIERREDG